VSALDRIRRVTLLDVKPGDLLLIEVAPIAWDPESGEQNPLEETGDSVRMVLDRIGMTRDKVGVLVATRGSIEARIVRAGGSVEGQPA
jgi:hypothetical protein